MILSYQFLAILSHLPNSSILTQGRMGEMVLPHSFDYSTYLTQDCTYTLSDPVHAFLHVNNILIILVDISVESATSFDATPAFQDYLAWMLDSFVVAHDIGKRWKSSPRLRESCESSNEMNLHAVQSLLSSPKTSSSDSVMRKGFLILTNFCAEVLETPDDITGESTPLCLCRCLLNLALACREHDAIQRAVSIHLLPAVRFCFENPDTLSKLGNDFQV